jgi:hypothetical protein
MSASSTLRPSSDDPVALRRSPQARLTMLYRSTDWRSCAGAPVKNLSHSASFDSCDKGAPSNCGIKHLDLLMNLSTTARGLASKADTS